MAGQHHVLLIGIDAYDGGGSLTGCVNDIDAVQRLLIDKVGITADRIKRLASPRFEAKHDDSVPAAEPTLDTIKAELTRLGDPGVVDNSDRVLVYYSGHGTQCIVTDAAQQRRFPREALLPKDKLVGIEDRFLFDWEVNALLANIAKCTPRATVILDCCSSAGITRGPEEATTGERYWPTEKEIPVAAIPRGSAPGVLSAVGAVDACQVIAACREDQRARESLGAGGRAQGELTRALVAILDKMTRQQLAELHWGRIWRELDAAVRKANPCQSPWLHGRFGRRVFGFGVDEDGDVGYAIVQVPGGYELDAGTLHGVGKDALIAVYGATPATFPPIGSPADRDARHGHVQIVEASLASSRAVAPTPFLLPPAPRGRLIAAGADKLPVRVTPDDQALRDHIDASGVLVADQTSTEVELRRRGDGTYVLVDDVHGDGSPGDKRPVLIEIPDATTAIEMLEHYRDYVGPLRMARRCADLPNALRLSVLDCNNAQLTGDAAQTLELPIKTDVRHGDLVCFAVDNGNPTDSTKGVALYVTLFDCAMSGRVSLVGTTQVPMRGRFVFWSNSKLGAPFKLVLPDDRALGVDRFVAIGTTDANAKLDHFVRTRKFADLLPDRGLRGGLPQDDRAAAPAIPQWTAATLSLPIRRA